MRSKISITFLLLFTAGSLFAQIDVQLAEDIRQTGYIHSPLPLDFSKAYETNSLSKKVLNDVSLCQMESLIDWTHKGIGAIELSETRSKDGSYSLRLTAPSMPETMMDWGLGRGTCMAEYNIKGANWESFNRLHFYVYPQCEGARTVYLNLYVENDGKVKVPDRYGREGYHEINLINNQWNECFVEMTELPRDKVTALKFAIEIFGKEQTMGETLQFDVDKLSLQTIENPEVVSGWQPANERIILSTTGYRVASKKSAIVRVSSHDGTFSLIDQKTGNQVYKGAILQTNTRLGHFEIADFTDFQKEGTYTLQVGQVVTMPFYIDANVWDNSAWRVLNFMFVERCGYPVPQKHGSCHTDLNGTYKGSPFTINGGWHDAADMSQQTMQTGEIAFAMMEMARRAKEKEQTQLYLRLMEEARWGIDYVLRSRLGDGYRVQTWGTNLWTDGFIGTQDDAGRRQVRIHNGGFENFVYSAVEAYAAMTIESDPMMVDYLTKIAQEDYEFAKARFDSLGYDERISGGGGHAYMASHSQYMATISWASSLLYQLTGKMYYAQQAAEAIKYTLACQRAQPLNDKAKTCGFFYRDLAKKSIVHFTHQSRDQVFMQALTLLCQTQPKHPDFTKWDKSIRLYAGYLKNIMTYVQPYGMIPSGVYHRDEVKDSVNFYVVQVGINSGAEADYREQLENGVKLDKEHYLRVFPVWFSFKGNAAVHLATGKAAALCGKYLNDAELMDVAEQQLFWIVGRNPFGQSLIWGEGSNYCQLYTALPGETVGAIPVGMQSRFNEDTPYWPQFNTATYKEVWGSSAGKWFSLISEF